MKRRRLEPLPFDLPKCCRQPRSPGLRRPSRRGVLVETSGCENDSSFTSMSRSKDSPDPLCIQDVEIREFSMAKCPSDISHVRLGSSHSTEVEPCELVSIEGIMASDYTRNIQLHPSDHSCSLFSIESSVLPSEVKGGAYAWLVPGRVVWAKISSSEWWPAKIMNKKAPLHNLSDGLILVQLYGSHECVWLDAVGGLSEFDFHFEERINNPLKNFQDALKQALHRKEQASPSKQSDQSSAKCNISSPPHTHEVINERKGKRTPKKKVHFDELALPEKSVRRVRRMRIMRHLGLTPPIGSPFSQPGARSSR